VFHQDGPRRYYLCDECLLVHLDRSHWPTPDEERQRYLLHRNHRAHDGYVQFLRRLADPVAERVTPGSRGLDFGCGPAPVLAELMSERGHVMASYDPLFHADRAVLDAQYDFITCCEVLEHVHDPNELLGRMPAMLRDRGLLGVMTSLRREDQDFGTWRYRRDPTHVCFYHDATLEWIARQRGWALERPTANVALYTIPAVVP
jgi:2-polyprenyl-3-methyl-5-hydroxy-6-metoxy-1,4-benzoquinol methylase